VKEPWQWIDLLLGESEGKEKDALMKSAGRQRSKD
jgi:hypothetical protein